MTDVAQDPDRVERKQSPDGACGAGGEALCAPGQFRDLAEGSAYAQHFYEDLFDLGTLRVIARLASQLDDVPVGGAVLDYGCGPTAYVPIVLAPAGAQVVMCDPSPVARAYVAEWVDGAHDDLWMPYARWVCDRGLAHDDANAVMATARNSVRSVRASIGPEAEQSFDLVAANFSLEAQRKSIEEWIAENTWLAGLLRPGGCLFACYLIGASRWRATPGGPDIESTSLQVADVERLAAQLRLTRPSIELVALPGRDLYEGFVILHGRV